MNRKPLSRKCVAAIAAAILIGTAAHDASAAPSGYVFTPIAYLGNAAPGGGTLVNASLVGGNVHVNNGGDVVFSGIVDTDVDVDGFADTGLFVWSRGTLSAIARTGTVIPGVGTIDELASPQLVVPPVPIATTTSGAINNDRGQVLFMATLTDGKAVLLLATPRP